MASPLEPLFNLLRGGLNGLVSTAPKNSNEAFTAANPLPKITSGIQNMGSNYMKAVAPLNTNLEQRMKGFMDNPNRYNPIAQVQTVTQMSPEQKQDYRARADQTVKPFTLSSNPQNPAVQNPVLRTVGNIGQGLINTPAEGVAAAAKLPAASSPMQAAGDVWDVAKLVGLLLSGVDLSKAGINALNPSASPTATKMVGKPMAEQTAEMAKNALTGRPAHQIALENAINSNNLTEVANILKTMPADAYKQSMISLFGPILQNAGIAL